jgi:hypothetical protein
MQGHHSHELRERAEKLLASRPALSLTANLPGRNESRLIHELEVYQIELEL